MTTTKPREWLIAETTLEYDEAYPVDKINPSSKPIHVIEYSAYQALEQENAKLKGLVEMADELMFLDDSPAFSKAYDEYIKAKESAGMG